MDGVIAGLARWGARVVGSLAPSPAGSWAIHYGQGESMCGVTAGFQKGHGPSQGAAGQGGVAGWFLGAKSRLTNGQQQMKEHNGVSAPGNPATHGKMCIF